jgi:oligoendopeptidase F
MLFVLKNARLTKLNNFLYLYMETLIAHPANKEQLNALKAFMKALKVDFKVEKSPYNPEFVAKIEKSKQEIKEGKGVRIKVEDLWK